MIKLKLLTAKVYNAEIKRSIKVDGKTFTAKQLMSMNPEGKAMFPNVEKLQARAVFSWLLKY